MSYVHTLIVGLVVAGIACPATGAQHGGHAPIHLAAEALRAPNFNQESQRQNRIFHSKGREVPAGYVLDRSLLAYSFMLRAGFVKTLAQLGPSDRWLDIGAGEGRAVLDYYSERFDAMHKVDRAWRGAKARAVAISIEDRRTADWSQMAARLEKDQIRYLSGRRLREYTVDELGRFELITDVLGGFTYTQNLSLFMENVLSLLQLNGKFYTLLQYVRYENAADPSPLSETFVQTEIIGSDGSEARVCNWLKQITCVEVACEPKPQGTIPIEAYRVRKVCDPVVVPSLTRIHFEAGAPPERRFKWGDSPVTAPVRADIPQQ